MSRRTSIVTALAEKLKLINGTLPYKTNLSNNAFPYLRFWDEINDFPAVYMAPGTEQREYLPGNFIWAFLGVSIKLYCKHAELSQEQLEALLEDVEIVINNNRVLVYDTDNGFKTTDISITSIITDESLLRPYGVGEINILVRYDLPIIA